MSRRTLGIVAVVLTAVGLLFVNAGQRAPVPLGSALFQEWSLEVESTLQRSTPQRSGLQKSGREKAPGAPLVFAVNLATPEDTESWHLAVTGGSAAGSTTVPESAATVSSSAASRLLSLAREAKLFEPVDSIAPVAPAAGKEQAVVTIAQGDRQFAAVLDPAVLRKNLPALSLITLLREYRSPRPALTEAALMVTGIPTQGEAHE